MPTAADKPQHRIQIPKHFINFELLEMEWSQKCDRIKLLLI
jgi:hypothetical protein